jgi:hypothetical protein
MTVQSAIFYITQILGKSMFIFSNVLCERAICYFLYYKIVDSATFVYIVYHVIWYLPIKFEE